MTTIIFFILLVINLSCANSSQNLSLTLGQRRHGQLTAAQSHSYALKLAPQEYARLSVTRQGGEALITVQERTTSKLTERIVRAESSTPLSILAEKEATYIVTVRSLGEIPITYELNLEEKRPVVAADQVAIEAEKNIAEAEQLYKEGTAQTYQEALEKLRTAAKICDQINQPDKKAYALHKTGLIHHALGDFEQALISYQQAIELGQLTANTMAQIEAYNNKATVLLQRGEREKAQEACTVAQQLSKDINYKRGIAHSLLNQGAINNISGEPQTALQNFDTVNKLWQEIEEYEKQAETHLYIAESYFYLGQYKNVILSGEQALELYQRLANDKGRARALTLIGHAFSTIGNKQTALNKYQLADPILQRISDKVTEYSLLTGKGFIYGELGEPDNALRQYEKAMELARAIGYREDEILCARHIADLHQRLGNHNKALAHLQQALKISQVIKDRRLEAQVLQSLGGWRQAQRDYSAAQNYYQKAIALYPPTYSARWKAYIHNNMGAIYEGAHNFKQAETQYLQALSYNLAAEDRFGEAQTHYQLAHLHRDKGSWSEATAHIQKAIALTQAVRSQVISQQLRTSYFASVNQIFSLYVDILMQQYARNPSDHLAREAISISEQARARTLLDLLNESRYNLKHGVNPKLLEQEQTLQQTLSSKADRKLQLRGTAKQAAELQNLTKEIEDLTIQLDEVRGKIRETSPHYAALTQPQPLRAEEIQHLLDEDTVLLEYLLGDERSYLWAVSRTAINAYPLPGRVKLEAMVRELYQLLTAPSQQDGETPEQWTTRVRQAQQQYWPRATELSQAVLGPAREKLSKKRLLIVGDGALQLLPFAALPEPMGTSQVKKTADAQPSATVRPSPRADLPPPLMVNHEITCLPSASALKLLREDRRREPLPRSWLARVSHSLQTWWGKATQPPARLSVAVLADPVFEKDDKRLVNMRAKALPSLWTQTRAVDLSDENLSLPRLVATREEAEEIRKAAGTNAFLLKQGFAVNRSLLESDELNAYSVIHFATHGFWDSRIPELSALFLSRFDQQGNKLSGALRLSDIYNLKLPKELVVLSACETAIGRDIRGEGLVALTRGFMYAGAARVMATLWKVEDAATAEMMKIFYQRLLQDNLSPAAALRQAQIAMWQKSPSHPPYTWAAFVIQGEYR